jgi:epoxyqueuosine reductase
VPHESGLAGAQVAVQFDERAAERGAPRQLGSERTGVVLGGPLQDGGAMARQGAGSYNRRVTLRCGQIDGPSLVATLGQWGRELGFSQIGVAGVDLSSAEPGLLQWLSNGFHGEMAYMATHGLKRARPAELVPGTLSVITARMDYLPATVPEGWQAIEFHRLERPREAAVSLYARGRDYHKVMRARLQKLSDRIAREIGPFGHRVFTDSAPVLEAELAVRSGQGWRGKHTLVLSREAGSMFFLGEIYVDLELPASPPVTVHCGSCTACIDICPTGAIVGEQRLDARRCISYLTIEHAGPIPDELRPLMGNRIYGCDDCQLACPWNKYAARSPLPDFDERAGLAGAALAELLGWSEQEFLRRTEGSAIRRIGHERWLRNVAVAAGNALRVQEDAALRAVLQERTAHPSALVREHAAWALAQRPLVGTSAHPTQIST